MASSNIYEIPCDPDEWRWISPTSIMYGEDGEVYVKPTARTWGNQSHYSLDNHGVDPCQVRRLDIHDWEVLVAPDVALAAGIPDSDWLRVLLWEPERTPRNQTDMAAVFFDAARAMGEFGLAAGRAGRALASGYNIALPSTGHKVTQALRRGSKVFHVPIVDKATGEIATLVLSESKFKKLAELGGEKITQILFDDIPNMKTKEDDALGLMDILALFDDEPRKSV